MTERDGIEEDVLYAKANALRPCASDGQVACVYTHSVTRDDPSHTFDRAPLTVIQ